MNDLTSIYGQHLNYYLTRIKWMLKRHLRHYANRLMDSQGEFYGEDCISRLEVQQLLDIKSPSSAQAWLDQLGVESTAHINNKIALIDQEITEFVDRSKTQNPDIQFPIERLRSSFGLNFNEMMLLVAAAAPRLQAQFSRLYAFAWADPTIKQPPASFLVEVVSTTDQESYKTLDLLDFEAPLVRHRLLILRDQARWHPQTPVTHACVQVPTRVLDFMQGKRLNYTRMPGCKLIKEGIPLRSLVLHKKVREEISLTLAQPDARLVLVGDQGSGRCTVISTLAQKLKIGVLEVNLGQALAHLPQQNASKELLAQLAQVLREARLLQAILLFNCDDLAAHPLEPLLHHHAAEVRALFDGFPGRLLLSVAKRSEVAKSFLPNAPKAQFKLPDSKEQYTLWRQALSPHMKRSPSRRLLEPLARAYRLLPGTIHLAVDSALRTPDNTPKGSLALPLLLAAVRRQIDHKLGWLAQPYSVDLLLDDVVLCDEIQIQIQEILRYARQAEKVFDQWGFARHSPSGRGLSVMFSGPPGTGKTLVAGVLARELGQIIYRVDLSSIVDKYIGETEKNLGKVFDEAERAQAILLFDEADSLFAKRTTVKSSNDRYANLEVNFLLQRLEAFNGVSILTTNFVTSIDEAFQRRIRFKVAFPMPDAEARTMLWQKLLPPSAPLQDDIDFDELGAQFELSGGHIRNVVLRAAMNAADLDQPIGMSVLWDAAVAECREMGILVTEPGPMSF